MDRFDEALVEFCAFLHQLGLDIELDDIVADGEIHRCPLIDEKAGRKGGAYKLHTDDPISGYGENHKTKAKGTWTFRDGHRGTPKHDPSLKNRIACNQKKREKVRDKSHSVAARNAKNEFSQAKKADPNHAYLNDKRIRLYGDIRQDKHGNLLIALMGEDGEMQTLQRISANGRKTFYSGAKMKEACYSLGVLADGKPIFVSEGYATAATIMAVIENGIAVMAIDSANLPLVAKMLSQQYPNSPIIICADDDHENDINVGLESAQKAAKEVNGSVVSPRFKNGQGLSDFNDLLVSEGIEEVRRQIAKAPIVTPKAKPFSFKSLTLDEVRAGRYLDTQPGELAWTLDGSLLQGIVAMVVATGSTGKGFMSLLISIAIATEMQGLAPIFEASATGKVLCLFGEESDIALHHRVNDVFTNLCERYADKGEDFIEHQRRLLNENLFVLPGQGLDWRLIEQGKGNCQATATYRELLGFVQSIPDLKLIVVDPLSRFFSGNENDNTEATHFCTLLEDMAKRTGASVILTHHTNKSSSGKGASLEAALCQNAARGASGFSNAVRWLMNMVALSPKDASDKGVAIDNALGYVAGKVAKKNIGPAEDTFYLGRIDKGVLVPLKAPPDSSSVHVQNEAVSILRDMLEQGEAPLRSEFPRQAAKQSQYYGRSKLEEAMMAAIKDGKIIVVEEPNEQGRPVSRLQLSS